MLNKASRQKPKGMETPGKHVSSDARHVIKWNFFDRIRQLKEALFRRMMKEAIAKRWTQDDFIIRGTGTPKPHTTLPTIAPTLLTTEKTTTTVATTTTQGALQTTLADFWKTLRKLWGNRHNPFG
ncbi:uncharacterized protein LOC128545996 [Mercenaria mercenaria]|uniref:uncharacterized protein LOC128545996 n=1 Tax=Mercenaria mercenaria TaxID=6596 RepID=UPI00234E38BD|nr:uncharacterized protein LOC128545996 [Mercenaria mercenaria]